MVRIVLTSLLTLALALSFSVASADDTISANQLESLNSAAAGLAVGATGTVTLTIGGVPVAYTVTKDSVGNITATGPANAAIQTIAISSGSSATNVNVPLAVTIISSQGAISSFNITTDTNGTITAVTSTASGTVVQDGKGTVTTNTTTTSTASTTNASGSTTDSFAYSGSGSGIGGGGATTGTVSITFAPGTSPTSIPISPHY